MKICIISNLYHPYGTGGAEINARKMSYALQEAGERVFVITTRPFSGIRSLLPEVRQESGIKVYRFYPLNLFHVERARSDSIPPVVKALWRIIDIFNVHTFFVVIYILKREKPDIVHTTNLGGLSFSAMWAARLAGRPLVHTLRDYHLLCPYAGDLMCPWTDFTLCRRRPNVCLAYSWLKKIIAGSLPSVIIGPSQFVLDMHKKNGFFSHATFVALPNFIDIPPERLQDTAPADKQTLDITYVGRLIKAKGVGLLIEAFSQIPGDFMQLHIVGEGQERQKLETAAAGDERIVFHGLKDHNAIASIYAISDVVVVPSIWYENSPTVILEAFANGVPVIGSAIGGIPEQVKDGVNGFLFKAGSSAGLAEAIRKFASDFIKGKAMLKVLSANARSSSAAYSKESIVQAITRIYERYAKGR